MRPKRCGKGHHFRGSLKRSGGAGGGGGGLSTSFIATEFFFSGKWLQSRFRLVCPVLTGTGLHAVYTQPYGKAACLPWGGGRLNIRPPGLRIRRRKSPHRGQRPYKGLQPAACLVPISTARVLCTRVQDGRTESDSPQRWLKLGYISALVNRE